MPSILVVEQEPRYVERINSALSAEGWRVRVVPGADQALQSASAEAPDLVLLSSEVPGAEAVAHFLSRSGGGPGVLALLPEGEEGAGAEGLRADDQIAKPFSDQDLVLAARRALLARPQPAPAAPPVEHRLTSQDIFGDVLAEFEDGDAPAPAAPRPRPAAPQAPRPAAAAPRNDDINRRLEQTLSGVLGPEPRKGPQAVAPEAPPAAPRMTPVQPAAPVPAPPAPAPPQARRAESLLGSDDVDALLSKTLSNLELGRTKPGAARPPASPPAPAAAAPPVRPPEMPPRAVPIPPPLVSAAPPPEGTAVRKAPRPVGDFDFSELEELARTSRRSEPARSAAEPPRPATPAPPPSPPLLAEPAPIFDLTPLPDIPPLDLPPALPPSEPALRAEETPLFSAPPPAPEPPPAVPPAPSPALGRPPEDFAATQRIPVFADEPGERFGQYTLLERIAVGGMAEVWKARMRGVEGFQKTVAIKRILSHMTDNSEFVGMFIDEAKLAAQLSHPNIVHIYDLGKIGRDYYIAMEYVEGRDLRSLLNVARKKGMRLPLGLALLIAARVASALDYAHRKRDFEDREMGLVHRDVSPQNVLLTSDGDVKLCDFGIAKAVSKASHTQVGALKGKLQYMSPEQAWGRPLDGRSDIFSLGAVLFEMVTGERLFPGDSELSVLEAVRQGRIRSPRQVDPSIPREVDEIVTRALAIEPQDRFASAGEMKQRIEAALAALSPSPGPTDLAAFIHRALSAEPVEESEPAVSFAPPPPEPAPVVFERPAPLPEAAPVEAVAPVGEVLVEEEGGRKGRGLLYAAIAALIVVAVLTFFFLNSRRRTGEPAPPAAGAPPAQSPGPAAAAASPGGSPVPLPAAQTGSAAPAPVDMTGLAGRLDEQLAKKEEELRRKLEAEEARLKDELEKARKENKLDPVSASPQTASPEPPPSVPPVQTPEPEPTPRQSAPQPLIPPTPAPADPEPEPEPQKPQIEERAEPEPTPEAPRVRVGELVEGGPGIVPPQLVSFPKPEYPPLARSLRVEGTVVVSVLVDENGKVQDVRMVEPIQKKVGINEAAVAAARNARYRPATKEGVRVKMWTRLRIPFKL
ncbi:MAG TPA: TonB family protein [Thermoanaerobaculia bacterium]|nr:TonB family protein [Thermoanaerobaculia bacterium]